MTQELAAYWSRLQNAVHPDDQATFGQFGGHGFDLNYPPPAFVGDVVHAPIIILDNNGGYDAEVTPREFTDTATVDRFRAALAQSLPASPGLTAPYYLQRNYSSWLRSGTAALVNGVAYRSKDGKQARVQELTAVLPSAEFHRQWLLNSLMPLVRQGLRCLVVHRWSRWNGTLEAFRGDPNVVFSRAPVSKDLTAEELAFAQSFLERNGTTAAGAAT